jgi:hypothetical protein
VTRLLRLLVAIALIGGSIVAAAASIYALTRTGNCGAPGAAIAVRECPDGTGGQVLLLITSIFVAPFAGFAIAPTGRVFLGVVWWCFVWIAMGAAAFVAGYGPAAPAQAEEGALGVGITFLAIGGLSLLGLVVAALVGRSAVAKHGPPLDKARTPAPPPRAAAGPTTPVGGPRPGMATLAQQLGAVAEARAATEGDPLAARLRKLEELRRAGLITDGEYDTRRREILGEV